MNAVQPVGLDLREAWEERQTAFLDRVRTSGLGSGTIVVVPSLSFPTAELCKLVGVQFYEERMLFIALFLRDPGLRIVYVTSMPVDPAIVDYYLRFLPDPDEARRRLHLLDLGDPTVGCLSQKVLDRPEVQERVRELTGDLAQAYLLPFNVTSPEQQLAEALDLPLYGPRSDLAWLGTKSGSREVAAEAGIPRPEGGSDLFSVPAVEAAIAGIRHRRPAADAVVIKLNSGTSGQGNAIVELDGLASPLSASTTQFCADEESWPSFEAKIRSDGVVVEELLCGAGRASPSVQLQILGPDDVQVISTHDQILGGLDHHQYLGCRFPADTRYRRAIQDHALRAARVLASRGVIGQFGIDFLVLPGTGGDEVYLSEINLRLGGTTHPFWTAKLVTEGTYDPATGELVAAGRAKSYVASDNLKSARLLGRGPAQVIEAIDRSGLGYDPCTRTGATLHLLGALRDFGKMGVTCIADSPAEADELYRRVEALLV